MHMNVASSEVKRGKNVVASNDAAMVVYSLGEMVAKIELRLG